MAYVADAMRSRLRDGDLRRRLGEGLPIGVAEGVGELVDPR